MRPPSAETIEAEIRDAMRGDDWTTVARLEAMLDAFDATRRNQREAVSLHSAALYYAEQGLHVFPLQPGAKIPYKGSRGCKDGTTDAAQVTAWWTAEPTANIGIATGHHVDVIDIDGAAGVQSWARAMYDAGDRYIGPAVVGKVSTPRPGGNHLYIAADPDKGNRAGILPGVDYRGVGGYVVAPPSHTELGTYAWYLPLTLAAAAEAAA